MRVEVLQSDTGEAAAYQCVLQERERGAAIPIQERVGGENLGVEADRSEHELVKRNRVGLLLRSGRLVELTADLLEAARDASAGRGAFALDHGVLGSPQDDPIAPLFLWLAEMPRVLGERGHEDDLVQAPNRIDGDRAVRHAVYDGDDGGEPHA